MFARDHGCITFSIARGGLHDILGRAALGAERAGGQCGARRHQCFFNAQILKLSKFYAVQTLRVLIDDSLGLLE